MKSILSKNNTYMWRFDANEDVIQSIAGFSLNNSIKSAYFSCIGSAKEVLLSYYNLETKQYEDHLIQEELEVVSITGNIAYMNDKPIIHAHGVFSKRDLSTIGGHIKKLIVSATCEVFITTFDTTFTRAFDEETGLNLFK